MDTHRWLEVNVDSHGEVKRLVVVSKDGDPPPVDLTRALGPVSVGMRLNPNKPPSCNILTQLPFVVTEG